MSFHGNIIFPARNAHPGRNSLVFFKNDNSSPIMICCHEKTFLCAFAKASLTVECAFILPLFLLAFCSLILFMDAAGIQSKNNLELSNKARTAAMYGSVTDADDMWIDLQKTYRYKIPIGVFPLPDIRIPLRARVRVWSGSSGGMICGGTEEGSNDFVYVTEYESVYHTDPSCTHLNLSVISSDTSRIGSMRNIYGRKYKKCAGFPKGYKGTVYMTETGDKYYPSTAYAGLTRHVKIVKRSDAAGLKLCERCSAHEHAA